MKEKLYVNINGIKEGMFLQGNKEENPVLLFLHGGPGSPEIFHGYIGVGQVANQDESERLAYTYML